jgi:hypothetical protein
VIDYVGAQQGVNAACLSQFIRDRGTKEIDKRRDPRLYCKFRDVARGFYPYDVSISEISEMGEQGADIAADVRKESVIPRWMLSYNRLRKFPEVGYGDGWVRRVVAVFLLLIAIYGRYGVESADMPAGLAKAEFQWVAYFRPIKQLFGKKGIRERVVAQINDGIEAIRVAQTAMGDPQLRAPVAVGSG